MPNSNFNFEYHSYILPGNLIKDKYNIHIYYKNMDIEWVLEKFSINEIQLLSEKILQKTKHVNYNSVLKIFVCKNKWGWNKVEKILLEHYIKNQNNQNLPDNLPELSIKNFVSNNAEWTNRI